MFAFFRNLKIGPRLAVGFGSLALFMLVIMATSMAGFFAINQDMSSIEKRDEQKALVDESIRLMSRNGLTSFQLLLAANREEREKLQDTVLENRKLITANIEELNASIDTKTGKEMLAKAIEARKEYNILFAKFNKLLDENKRDEAVKMVLTERVPALNALIASLTELKEYQSKLAKESVEQGAATYAASRNAMLGTGLLALFVGALLAFFIARQITRSTRRLRDTVQRVADGDYTARSNLETSDELGILGRAFDGMLNERVASLAQKEKESESVNASFIDVMRAVSKLSRGDLTVKAPVREDITGALADAINSMSDATARTLAGVAGISHEVRSASQQGRDTVLSTARGMSEIRGTIQETGKRIKRLGERSQEITGIVKLIDDIAERTSVLALNANMQAAMAGEAGRGFRVVADEVQRLAERSKEATDQISKLVTNIQSETNDTMATMDRAIGEVVKGGELAEKAAAQVTHLDDLGGTLLESVQAFTLPEEFLKEGQAAARGDTGRRAA